MRRPTQVELEEGQTHCSQCSGFGEVCTRCAFPPDECECDGNFYHEWEQCPICDGVGVEAEC